MTDVASTPFTAPTVVVGVDGSRAAHRAAIWAIDEARSRGIPLRLVAVDESVGQTGTRPAATRSVATVAEAVRAADRSVEVQTDVVSGAPTLALLEASRTAAMVVVGAVGLRTLEHHRIGSTARALAASAHCPVAVVRGGDRSATQGRWIVVEIDETPASAAVLQWAVAEARLRSAPLRVLGCWRSTASDAHDAAAVTEGNRRVGTQLDRRLSQWQHRYPDLDVRPEAVHGSALDYLTEHADRIALVVVGARNTAAVETLLGPAGQAVLHGTDVGVLVVDPQRLL